MGVTLQPAEVQRLAHPVVTVVPPPNRAGRYRVEFGNARPVSVLPFQSCCCEEKQARALVWLTFLEEDREASRELTDVICSGCEPDRYQRARHWADQRQQAQTANLGGQSHSEVGAV